MERDERIGLRLSLALHAALLAALETGGVMLGDELKLELDVELIKSKDAAV